MISEIKYTPVFEKYFKPYSKKYPSLANDLKILENELLENPKLGSDLGGGLYKIRLAVKSKNKGKSGGFRVITYLLAKKEDLLLQKEEKIEITLVILYDKSEITNLSKQELLNILQN